MTSSFESSHPARPQDFAALSAQSLESWKMTPVERLIHTEKLRQAYYGYDEHSDLRIQKTVTLIDLKTGLPISPSSKLGATPY